MRPHRLRVTAFGPFPGTVDLDLDQVSEAGPFLLRGATGAGKTSLLDAVGYALFGKVPGSRGMKQLRSDFAPTGTRTSVELWATVSGRAVHVVRTPDQPRPRSRGAGTTTDKATVVVRVARDLAALDGDDCDATWSGVQEANAELADLVGMTHEQFVQVVLLPQGDFARFLRAHDGERADVLRALFDTSRFSSVEQHLKARRDATALALAEAGAGVGSAAQRVAAHAGLDELPSAPPAGRPGPTGLVVWADDLLLQAATAGAAASAGADAATEAARAARVAHGAAVDTVRVLADLDAVARSRRELLASAPGVAQQRAELAAADRAAEVVELSAAAGRALDRAEQARQSAAQQCLRLADPDSAHPDSAHPDSAHPDSLDMEIALLRDELPPDVDESDEQAASALSDLLRSRLTSAVGDLARLDAASSTVLRLQEVALALTSGAARAAEIEAAADADRVRRRELPARVAALQAEHSALAELAGDLDAAGRAVSRWQGLAELSDELARLHEQASVAESADLAARQAARTADDDLDRLRQARLDGMSAELAEALVAGQPCTVCGGTEHPAPARPTGTRVDADGERAARDGAARRAAAAAATGAELARHQTSRDAALDSLRSGAEPELTVPDLAALDQASLSATSGAVAQRLDQATARLAEARRAGARTDEVVAGLARLIEEQGQVEQSLAHHEQLVAGLAATREAAETESARLSADLVQALGVEAGQEDPAAVHNRRLAEAVSRRDVLDEAAKQLSGLVAALADLRRCRTVAAERCRADGWPDAAAADAASRPRSRRTELRQAVDDHDRQLHAADQRLAELRRHELTGDEPGRDELGRDEPGRAELGRDELGRAGGAVAALLEASGGPSGDDWQGADALVAAVGTAAGLAQEREQDLAARLAEAETDRDEAGRLLTGARSVLDGLRRSVPVLRHAVERTGPLQVEADDARALAELCSGANDRGIPLSTYVLAAHLEHVVAAANRRLHGMSDGRYALVHVEEGEDRRRRAGLGLGVLDAWTGIQRPAGTLSGGETFLASLALALGLADVVTAEAGGVRIDALFVDEGFGTLDTDSLDRAMDVLDELQEHGRMVGVVSHVGELHQRLPRQVHVEGGRAGSTVRVVSG